jgi:ABC-2 type transport system ATP-binding protein
MIAIQTENLVRKFGWVKALDTVNLHVEEQSIYALVGPNGAGKTTLIKTLMNIIPPTSGRAQIMGQDSRYLRGAAFADIGYVSENQAMPDRMLLREFLHYLRPFYPRWDSNLASELLQQFELPLDRRLKHFSRGMRMKAALASSLAYHPRLIVLDEPFGGLDPLVRDELISAIIERAAEATVFISSHDLGEIESFASHVGYLDAGRLRFSEEINVLNERFRDVELTLEAPPTLPADLPSSWLQVTTAGRLVKFVESRFDPERTTAQIGTAFASVRQVSFNPMSLRSIFLATAKARAKGGE